MSGDKSALSGGWRQCRPRLGGNLRERPPVWFAARAIRSGIRPTRFAAYPVRFLGGFGLIG